MEGKEKKCPKCGQVLYKTSTREIVSSVEKKVYIGYFCNNCNLSFSLKEIA